MQLEIFLQSELTKLKQQNLYRQLRDFDENLINFSSNNYLGKSFGSGSSRLVSGNTQEYIKLEKLIAKWKKTEAALVFPTGYMANLGAISALMQKGDLIIIDKLNHASIIDGCYLSGADLRVYKHKDLKSLEKILKSTKNKYRNKLIITESVFSMDGDIAPLKEIASLAKKYGAWTYVDEAHAVGIFGKTGAGVCEQLGLENTIDIKMGTLSKAIGSIGGYIAGSELLIDFLINKARSFIYTTALPPDVIIKTAQNIKIIISGNTQRKKLWENINYFYELAIKYKLNIQKPESAILPIIIGSEEKALKASKLLLKKGFLLPAIRYPTVAKGRARLRCTITAEHSENDLQSLLASLKNIIN